MEMGTRPIQIARANSRRLQCNGIFAGSGVENCFDRVWSIRIYLGPAVKLFVRQLEILGRARVRQTDLPIGAGQDGSVGQSGPTAAGKVGAGLNVEIYI